MGSTEETISTAALSSTHLDIPQGLCTICAAEQLRRGAETPPCSGPARCFCPPQSHQQMPNLGCKGAASGQDMHVCVSRSRTCTRVQRLGQGKCMLVEGAGELTVVRPRPCLCLAT